MTQLDQGQIAPIYLLTGEESYLIQSALDRLLESALDPSARDFNYAQIDGKGATSEVILNEVQSLPVFSERRLVVLKSADAIQATEANRLTGYLMDPAPTTCLAVVAQKIDARRTFFQQLTRNHPTVECHRLPEGQLPSWVRTDARSSGYNISEEATTFLIEQVGSDLFRLHNEMIKAGLMSGQKQNITRQDIQEVLRSGGRWAIPDLLEAVGERKVERALEVLKELMDSGNPALLILGSLARHVRQLLRIKQLLLSGMTDAAICKHLNLWRSIWPKVSRQTKAFSMEDLLMASRRLMETDAGIKGAALDNTVLMEILVMDLCQGSREGLRRFLGRQDLIYLER